MDSLAACGLQFYNKTFINRWMFLCSVFGNTVYNAIENILFDSFSVWIWNIGQKNKHFFANQNKTPSICRTSMWVRNLKLSFRYNVFPFFFFFAFCWCKEKRICLKYLLLPPSTQTENKWTDFNRKTDSNQPKTEQRVEIGWIALKVIKNESNE